MASYKELLIEWTMLDGDCNNWTLQDLQLAAELGRTLLERNEELENELKQQHAVIEDQAQEIEFLTKQATSMKEQSENRGKFYEQLEQTIIELERTNDHLSREHEIDKKRIQSLCENIEYLERKCEEMSRALETIRDEQAKRGLHGSRGKMNRGSYFNFGSDSSEEDNMNSGFGFGFGLGFRRRSHSLQDLRDYTPSPDEFDSGNSNSPDLKTSESEYVESLESRIEELMVAKKSEIDKVHQLESQIKLLIQENANLQSQLVQICNDKDEQIVALRRQLLDSGNYSQISFNTSAITATSTRRNSSIGSGGAATSSSHDIDSPLAILSPASPISSSAGSPRPSSSSNLGDNEASSSSSSSSTSSSHNKPHLKNQGVLDLLTTTQSNINSSMLMCKRCSTEVSILSLVNSIEVENDNEVNGCYPEFPYGVAGLSEDHDMEFSSLEHELARATGASLPLDNRHKKTPPRSVNRSFPLFPRHRTSIFQRDKSANKSDDIQLECDEELEYDENFELFLGHQPSFSGGGDGGSRSPGRRLFTMEESSDAGCSSSGTHDDDIDLDEEPCLAKDRKPEISRSKKNSGRTSESSCKNGGNAGKSSKKALGSRGHGDGSSGSGMHEQGETVPVKDGEHQDLEADDVEDPPAEDLNVTFTSSFHSKLLELPARIPSDVEDDDEEDDSEFDDDIAAKSYVPASSEDAILKNSRRDGELANENNNDQDKCQKGEPLKKTKYGTRESSPSSGYESEDGSGRSTAPGDEENQISYADEDEKACEEGTEVGKLPLVNEVEVDPVDTKKSCRATADKAVQESTTPSTATPNINNNTPSSVVPEYKQILQNLFSLFNNSKRKYPIPLYPYVKGQSSALMMKKSQSTTSTNNNNSGGCSSH